MNQKIMISFYSLLLFGFSTSALAENSNEKNLTNIIPDSKNRVVKFTDSGIRPAVLHMAKEDSIVFYLNDSTDSLTTIKVDYGQKATHCASANLKIETNGSVHSVKPFGPKNFATTCFHDPGTYPLTVYGLKTNPNGIKGTIVVE